MTADKSDRPSRSRPLPSFSVGGFAPMGTIRIRTGWFGFAVVEELYEYTDGTQHWRRLFLPKIISEGRSI